MIKHGRMGFVGVDTARSAIQSVFPRWADHLHLPTRELKGYDIPLDAPDSAYVEVVEAIRDDPDQAGALVTTHKMRLFAAAGSLFDAIDPFARACGEISSISKRGGRLLGHAKDPFTVGLALQALVSESYFADTSAPVVVLGAGGSGVALSWYLAHRPDRPRSVTLAALSPTSLDHARAIHRRGGLDTGLFTYHLLDPADPGADARDLVQHSAEGAVIANATGVGKDLPGSPLADPVRFPDRAVVWDFNYRGDLGFLAQAHRDVTARDLRISDGWVYFIHGWSQVVAEVFDIPMPEATVAELAMLAEIDRST